MPPPKIKIWRFPFEVKPDIQSIITNVKVIRILRVGLDPKSKPSIWAEVVPNSETKHRIQVLTVPTGGDAPTSMNYRAAIEHQKDIWHVYTMVL